MKYLKLKVVVAGCVLGLIGHPTLAATKVSVLTGIDDNPFRLTNSLNAKHGFFINTDLDYSKRFKNGLSINFNADLTEFEARVKDASSTRWDLGAGYRYKFNKRSRIDFDVSTGELDKTFVSRTTGQVGTFNDQSIPDRYDYSWQAFEAKYQYRVNKQHRLGITAELYNKDYFDYQTLNLTNFDYQHLGLELDWRYRINKSWTLYTDLRTRKREYESREARTLQGDLISGSLLEYQYNRIAMTARWNISDKVRLSMQLFNEDKQDNFSGYYDTTFSGYSISWRRETDENAIITARFRYQDYQNQNNVSEDEFEEELDTNDNRGFVLSFSFRKPFWTFDKNTIDGYFRTSLYHFKAEQRIYEYNRQLFEVGLRASF